VPLLLLGPPFFLIILFGSTTLLTGMTGISFYMQWPLTSQSHSSVSQREQLFFCWGSNSTPAWNPLKTCLSKNVNILKLEKVFISYITLWILCRQCERKK
jgi:hypothetical protein